MKRLLVFGAAVAALAAGTDFTPPADAAEDVGRPAVRRAAPRAVARPVARPAQAPASNWSGGQAGGQGGGSSGSQSLVDPPVICPFGFSCPPTPFSFSGSPGSFTGGGFIGYRVQLGWTVVGVEADASWKKLENSATQPTGPTPFGLVFRNESFYGTVTQGWDASFRGRAGFLVTPWTLVYATGGLAIGEVKGSFKYTGILSSFCGLAPCTTTVNSSWSDTRTGGTVGAGVETSLGLGKSPFGGGVKVRLEYRYTDFGKYSKTLPVSSNCLPGVCTSSSSTTADVQAAFHKVTAGIGFDF